MDGYTVLRERDRYVYAGKDAQGNLVASTWEVGKTDPVTVGLTTRLRSDLQEPPARQLDLDASFTPVSQLAAAAASSQVRNLVVL